jgi:hypothetical protein
MSPSFSPCGLRMPGDFRPSGFQVWVLGHRAVKQFDEKPQHAVHKSKTDTESMWYRRLKLQGTEGHGKVRYKGVVDALRQIYVDEVRIFLYLGTQVLMRVSGFRVSFRNTGFMQGLGQLFLGVGSRQRFAGSSHEFLGFGQRFWQLDGAKPSQSCKPSFCRVGV